VVAYAGSYNPHTKQVSIDKEKVEKYLSNGAQPSPRVVRLLEDQKIKLPHWVKRASGKQERTTRYPEKLRKNQPLEEVSVEPEVEESTHDTEEKSAEITEESTQEKTEKTEE
jgi:small subunit ribosomal protein S16